MYNPNEQNQIPNEGVSPPVPPVQPHFEPDAPTTLPPRPAHESPFNPNFHQPRYEPDPPEPVSPVHFVGRGPSPKPRKTWHRPVLIAAISVFLLALIVSVIFLVTRYQVQMSATAAGLELQFTPRHEQPEQDMTAQTPPPVTIEPPDLIHPPLEPPINEPPYYAENLIPPAVHGGGTTLTLHPRPEAGQLSFQEIFQRYTPSVVVIEVEFRGAFGGYGQGFGSGVVMTADGYIITNTHVIEDARQVHVVLANGESHPAAIVGADLQTDIAVLKIEATNLVPAEFGDSDLLMVGDEVVAIGNPLGMHHTMSNGMVSALNRPIVHEGISMSLIQTNAAINEGNSGGALINLYGQVIGITNMKMIGMNTSVEGMGFAIPTRTVQPVVNELIERGYVTGRPAIGISIYTVTEQDARVGDLPAGLHIQSVTPGTHAAEQGLLPGDMILSINGQPISTTEELRSIILQFRAGDSITLQIRRAGNELTVDVRLMDAAYLG